jgi:predicted DNA-binding WGR domain protein/3-methyladenine DNA glycosylase AlkC
MSGQIRRFEFNDGKSSKYWEIEVDGEQFTVRYGKIGTAGQSQVKDFADAAAASKAADKLIAEKTGKGYQEVGAIAPAVSATADAPPAVAKKAAKTSKTPKTAAPKPADLAKDPEADPAALEALAGSSEAIDRLLARNPKASASLLEKLSHSSDKTTRNHVVMHPNAPKDVLVKLAHQFPADFFKNPAFEWLLIEDPDLMQRIGGNVLGTLLKRPDCPQSFLNWAVKHGTEKERLAVAMNPEASEETLRELVSQGGDVAEAAMAHEKLAASSSSEDPVAVLEEEVRKAFGGYCPHGTEDWRRNLIGPAQWKALSPGAKLEVTSISNPAGYFQREVAVCREQAWIGNVAIDVEIVRRPLFSLDKCTPASDLNSPAELLEQLASDPDLKVRREVAKNPRASVKALTILTADEIEQTRQAIAGHPLCSRPLLDQLAADPASGVRSAVAMHPLCSGTLLQKLAADPEPAVRAAVAGNYACPQELFPQLVTDMDVSVRRAMASNPACPVALLEVLAKKKGFGIADALADNMACPPEIQKQVGVKVSRRGPGPDVYALRYQPRPVDELRTLATSKNADIRLSVALNPACPPELLEVLAKDKNEGICFAIAKKPSCPPALSADIFENLSRSKNKDVLLAVARLIATPEAIRFAAYTELLNKLGPQGIKELDDEPLCPPLIREVVRARIWRQQLQSLAKKYGTQVIVDEALGNLDDQQLIAAARQEFASLNCEADQGDSSDALGLLSRVLNADQAGSILAIPIESADNAARHSGYSALAIRLLGLHHTHTSPDILAKRSKSTEWQERLAIASNPSCPPNVREKLKNDPHRLVAAAARLGTVRREVIIRETSTVDFVVLAIEVINRIRVQTPLALIGLISRSGWRGFVGGRQLFHEHLIEFIEHPACPPEIMKVLSADKDYFVRHRVAEHISCPMPVFEMLRQDRDASVRAAVAGNSACPVSMLDVLARSKDSSVLSALAGNPICPSRILEALAKVQDSFVLIAVAANPNCPLAILDTLAKDEDYSVRLAVASNPACATQLCHEILRSLAKKKDTDVRLGVARHTACPEEIRQSLFEALVKIKDSEVRIEVATNPACPDHLRQSLFEALAKDKDCCHREVVARAPACSSLTLEALANDKENSVRQAISSNPSCPNSIFQALMRDQHWSVRSGVAANPACPEAILEMLAKDEDITVRQSVAKNKRCPVLLHDTFLNEEAPSIVACVAENPSCSSSVLESLITQGDPWTNWLAIHHPNTSPEQLVRWAKDKTLHPILRLACVRCQQFPASEKALADEIVCLSEASPQAPENISEEEWILAFKALDLYPEDKTTVAKAAKVKDWLQRAAATFSPDIQPNQLKLLLEDSEEIVRQLASDRLRQRESGRS